MCWLKWVTLSLVVVGTGLRAASGSIVTNGGFESGLAGWTATGADLAAATNFYVHSGSFGFEGYDNTGFATLSQNLATTSGVTYSYSFWSITNVDTPANILRYQFDSGPIQTVPRTSSFAQTSGTFIATGSTTQLSFFFETDPGTGTWGIDDVVVDPQAAAVPEPATLAMFGIGALGLVGAALRRRRATT